MKDRGRNEPAVSGGLGSQDHHAQRSRRPVALAHPVRTDAARTNISIAVRTAHRLLPPMNTFAKEFCIGARTSTGEFVMLAPEERRRHLYIVGQTGTGKSTLLLNLIAQDLAADEGLALLDPHGDLATAALTYIPRSRTNDLIYINPADTD